MVSFRTLRPKLRADQIGLSVIGVHPNHFVAIRLGVLQPAEKSLDHGEIETDFRIVRRSIEGAFERGLGLVVKI
jgi:hypothetical protein